MEAHGYWNLAIFFLVHNYVTFGQTATADIDICDTVYSFRTRLAQIKSPDFPNPVILPRNCRCSVDGSGVMDITVKFVLNLHQGTDISISYATDDQTGSWPLGYHGNVTVSEENGLIIAENISSAEVIFKSNEENSSWSLFQIDMKASSRAFLMVNCSESPVQNNTDISNKDDDGILSVLEKLCSPYLVIILGSLCAAFLLIILVVSITLCCVVPKKRKKYLDIVRRSRMMNEDVKPAKYSKNKTESRIYDEAGFRKSQASYLEPPHLYGNTTQPVGEARRSVPMYANADALQNQ